MGCQRQQWCKPPQEERVPGFQPPPRPLRSARRRVPIIHRACGHQRHQHRRLTRQRRHHAVLECVRLRTGERGRQARTEGCRWERRADAIQLHVRLLRRRVRQSERRIVGDCDGIDPFDASHPKQPGEFWRPWRRQHVRRQRPRQPRRKGQAHGWRSVAGHGHAFVVYRGTEASRRRPARRHGSLGGGSPKRSSADRAETGTAQCQAHNNAIQVVLRYRPVPVSSSDTDIEIATGVLASGRLGR
mmetsp:Transcript_9286/g.26511  ORF Transcript_9286/g.26511 Transcript_9286/m.26511 type:complete len:244 (-) Transcript_9286:1147-1878(-)